MTWFFYIQIFVAIPEQLDKIFFTIPELDEIFLLFTWQIHLWYKILYNKTFLPCCNYKFDMYFSYSSTQVKS